MSNAYTIWNNACQETSKRSFPSEELKPVSVESMLCTCVLWWSYDSLTIVPRTRFPNWFIVDSHAKTLTFVTSVTLADLGTISLSPLLKYFHVHCQSISRGLALPGWTSGITEPNWSTHSRPIGVKLKLKIVVNLSVQVLLAVGNVLVRLSGVGMAEESRCQSQAKWCPPPFRSCALKISEIWLSWLGSV